MAWYLVKHRDNFTFISYYPGSHVETGKLQNHVGVAEENNGN
jgi:hypothetical protein